MKKKLLATLLTLTLSLGLLAGCGSTETASDSQSTDAQTESGDESSDDTIVINTCLATGMTGAVNNFAIEKGLYKELGIEFNNVEWSSNDGRPSKRTSPMEWRLQRFRRMSRNAV